MTDRNPGQKDGVTEGWQVDLKKGEEGDVKKGRKPGEQAEKTDGQRDAGGTGRHSKKGRETDTQR